LLSLMYSGNSTMVMNIYDNNPMDYKKQAAHNKMISNSKMVKNIFRRSLRRLLPMFIWNSSILSEMAMAELVD
jgi:hypothetical protein